jgi:conjugal transfer pilus assembly protein TraE
MTPDQAQNERDALKAQLHFHRLMNVGLLTVVLFGVWLLGWVMFRETTRIVPPEVRRPYEIGAHRASAEYLLDMADYVLGMVLTVTPQTVDHHNQVILKMTDPRGYPTLKTALDAAALRLKKERVTTIWAPRKEEVEVRAKRVTVSGRFKTFIADQLTSEHEKTYLVEFIVTTSGRLYVLRIEEVVQRSSA